MDTKHSTARVYEVDEARPQRGVLEEVSNRVVEKDSIVLEAVRDALSKRFDLSPEAFEFTNELIAEERQEYLIQVALTNESHE